jgi:large subunit ribosomal protein L24
MQKLKVGDTVQVTAGRERTEESASRKRGKVLTIDREAGRVRVEGLRLIKKHLRKGVDKNTPEGGILEKPGTIALAAVQVVCPKCDKPTRVGFKQEGDKKVRVCRKCEGNID